MGKTFSISQGEQMAATIRAKHIREGGLYDVQLRLGYRDGGEFIPQDGLDWTLEETRVERYGICSFVIPCPVPFATPAGIYDAELSIRIPGVPYPENKEVIIYKDNAVQIEEV